MIGRAALCLAREIVETDPGPRALATHRRVITALEISLIKRLAGPWIQLSVEMLSFGNAYEIVISFPVRFDGHEIIDLVHPAARCT